MNNRRSNIQIIGDILRLGEAGKTEIMYDVNMSYIQVKKYFDFLLEKGFLEKVNKNPRGSYRTTPKGQELLEQIDKIIALLEWGEE